MNVELNKLKTIGFPKVFYLNSDSRPDRGNYMEWCFEKWGIKNYERIATSRFSPTNYHEWSELILDENILQTPEEISKTINHLKTIIDWYDNSDEECCIIMEDLIDIKSIEQWMFDWETLYKNLPYNWDCIQLFFYSNRTVNMHLKPKDDDTKGVYCYMITRQFAKKIKELHYTNEKFKFFINNRNLKLPEYKYGSLESFLFDLGITYTLPVFYLSLKHFGEPKELEDTLCKLSSESIEFWWKIKSKEFSMQEFFSYNKRYDWKMEVLFDLKEKQVYMDKVEKIMLWI